MILKNSLQDDANIETFNLVFSSFFLLPKAFIVLLSFQLKFKVNIQPLEILHICDIIAFLTKAISGIPFEIK